jgi:hypothetical protein
MYKYGFAQERKMKIAIRTIAILTMVAAVSGCASTDYYRTISEANQINYEIQKAKYNAELAKFSAMAAVAQNADPIAQAVAVAMMAMSSNHDSRTASTLITPQQPQNPWLQWAGVLANPITQLGVAAINAGVSINASDNNTTITLGNQSLLETMSTNIVNGSTAALPFINPTPIIIR